ncbi:uncharacterized protein DNG_06820 [Cephalotrichum gorgonifer]|uniref:Uncharacterized protein n=1 Tax=Cephalotrichum gorgonifer TaxID=2041049 RepID=A0AAE8N3H1_9PEZI|nr:uncharacterized protein DNG_06820 [Cephalotrichum gorgonifer]
MPSYHLQFVNPSPSGKFGQTVNTYLRQVFKDKSPLKYHSHRTAEEGTVLIRFRLSRRGIFVGRTLESAGEELCQRIFDGNGENLSLLTTASFFGISACHRKWKRFFNRAFFSASVKRGSQLLNNLLEHAKVRLSYVPAWVMVFSFALFAGLNFSMFTAGGPANWSQAGKFLLEIELIQNSGELLKLIGYYLKGGGQDRAAISEGLEARAASDKARLCAQARKTIQVMKEFSDSPSRSSQKAKMCDSLFDLTKIAAEMVVSNEKLLEDLRQRRVDAITQFSGRVGGVAASAWTFISAIKVTAAAGASAATVAPVAVAAACALWNLYKGIQHWDEKEKLESRMKDLEEKKSLVISAWSLASDTELMLGWVYNTSLVDPSTFLAEDADDATKERLQVVRGRYNELASCSEREKKKFARRYLKVQRKTLEGTVREVEA